MQFDLMNDRQRILIGKSWVHIWTIGRKEKKFNQNQQIEIF